MEYQINRYTRARLSAMEGKTKIIVLVETDYLEVDYSGGAVSQNNFVPETYAYSYGIEELNKLRANEMIDGRG